MNFSIQVVFVFGEDLRYLKVEESPLDFPNRGTRSVSGSSSDIAMSCFISWVVNLSGNPAIWQSDNVAVGQCFWPIGSEWKSNELSLKCQQMIKTAGARITEECIQKGFLEGGYLGRIYRTTHIYFI